MVAVVRCSCSLYVVVRCFVDCLLLHVFVCFCWLVFGCSLMFVVRGLSFVVGCRLLVVGCCWLLSVVLVSFAVCCLLCGVRCACLCVLVPCVRLFVVCCWLLTVGCVLLFADRCRLFLLC